MKTIITIVTMIVIAVKVLSLCFDVASNEVRTQAQDRLDYIEQVTK